MLTLATCSFNTPDVTLNMLKSFQKYNKNIDILISENSTNDETATLLTENGYTFYRNFGFQHSICVDFLIEKCETKYMLLVDTDVLFLKSVEPLFNKVKEFNATLCGVLQGSRGGHNLYERICPWFCFIDIEIVKEKGIKFFDPVRLSKKPETDDDKGYDVGSSFLEDIRNAGLKVLEITEEEQNEYIIHFEGMSWRKNCGNP